MMELLKLSEHLNFLLINLSHKQNLTKLIKPDQCIVWNISKTISINQISDQWQSLIGNILNGAGHRIPHINNECQASVTVAEVNSLIGPITHQILAILTDC